MATKPNLLRATIAGDVICKQCHVPFLQNFANAELSHPIVTTDYLTGFAASDPRFKPATVDGNGRLSTNVSGGDVRLVNGGVSCTTCHSTHFADSAALTGATGIDNNTNYVAGTLAPGDGNLLRADGPLRTGADQNATAQIRSNLCQACHTYKMHGKTTTEDAAAVQIGCLDCHGGHSYNNGVPNVYVLRKSVEVPVTSPVPRATPILQVAPGTVTLNSYIKPYNSEAGPDLYPAWSDRSPSTADGYCEKCHGNVEANPILGASTSGHGVGALSGCTSCHKHDATGWTYSFKPDVSAANCGQCHGFPPYLTQPGDRPADGGTGVDGGYAFSRPDGNWNYSTNSGSYKDEATTGHLTHAGGNINSIYYFVGSTGTQNCDVCHGSNSGFNTRHRNVPTGSAGAGSNPSGASGDATSFRDVPFDSRAVTPGKPAPAYSANVCSNIECHSNGGPANDAGARTYTVANTPTWSGTGVNFAAGGFGSIFGQAAATRCSACHGNSSGTMTSKLNSAAHNKHIDNATYNYGCNICHANTAISSIALKAGATLGNGGGTNGKHVNQEVDVDYDGTVMGGDLVGSTWSGVNPGTCTTYCHSDGLATPTYSSPDWQQTGITCTSCHKGNVASGTPMSSGSHSQHINGTVATIGRQMGCVECHSNTVSSDSIVNTPANHVDGVPTWGIQADANKISCSQIKCHSNGNLDGGTVTYPTDNDYTWGGDNGTIGCASCHGNGTVAYPTYANGGIGNNSNSHLAHSTIACGECHASVSTNGTSIDGTTPANHVNMAIEVSGPKFTWVGGTETCNTITCHGSGSAQWGATALACGSCHQHATVDTDDFTYGNATTSVIATNEWTYSGHGKASGTYAVTLHPAANFPGAAGTGDPCKYCHDNTVTHNDANYFRLRQNGETDLNGVCLGCHKTGAAGVDPDGGLTVYASKNATVKVNKYHQGAKHGDPRDGGRWCWDCHDPHGDAINATTRIQMIQRRAQVNPNAYGVPPMPLTSGLTSTDIVFYNNTLGADAAGGFARTAAQTPVAAGLCNACHTTTQNPDTTALYRATTHTGTHSTAVCTTCHKHNPDNVYDGLAFQGSGCNGCHGAANGQYWPDGLDAVYYDNSTGSATAHNKHITAIGAFLGYGNWATVMYNDTQQKAICAFCHDANPGGAGHDTNSGDSIVDILGAGQLKRFNSDGISTELDPISGAYTAGSCATLSCHNGVATPVWNSGPASNCTTTCHGPNSDASAREGHLKHVNGKAYSCNECHIDNGVNYGHINGQVNLKFDNSGTLEVLYGGSDGSYSQALNSTPRDGSYGNCSVTYCHANKLSPNWNLTIAASGCIDCHTNGGATLNPNSGLHTGAAPTVTGAAGKHDETLAGGCAACHTVSALTSHVNGVFSADGSSAPNRTIMGLIGGYSSSLNNVGTCAGATVSGTSCHGNATTGAGDTGSWARVWDSSIHYETVSGNQCKGCHGGFGGTDWTFGADNVSGDGSVSHNRNWDGDANTTEVIGLHKDNNGNATRCNICHVYADTGYATLGALHRNGQIEMNSAMGYSTGSRDCSTSCHANNTNHNLEASGLTVNLIAGPALSCYTCHGNGSTTFWPSGASYPNRAGKHQAHINALAAKLGISLPGTQPQQQRMCAYCHNDATDIAGYSGQTGHATDNVPTSTADVGAFNPIWTVVDPPVLVDAGSSETPGTGTCTGIDCHNNVTASAGTFGWYDTPATSTCAMCHTAGATDAPHVAHLDTAMGTVTCLACHGSGTTTTTAPTAGHLDGTLSVVGTLIGTAVNGTTVNYSGGLNGTCGTVNACHTTGVYNGSVLTTPKGGTTFTWGVTTFAGCDACHETTSTLASGSHANHLLTTSQSGAGAITCNSCHTAATVSTHMNQSINFTGAATNYGTESMFNTTYLGNCGTNTCHNSGRTVATVLQPPYNNGLGSYAWNNNAIGAGLNTCTECHGNSGATLTSDAHDAHLNASAGVFGGTAMTCSSCHTAATVASHVDQTINITGMTYGGDVGISGTTFGSCGTNACHKNGQGGAPEVTSYDWNTTQADCSICHLAKPTTGAHNTHLTAVAWGPFPAAGTTNCSACHLASTDNTTMAGKATHINNTISFNGPSEVATGAMATDTGVSACNNCHGGLAAANVAGGAKKIWATQPARLACGTCHGDYTLATPNADGSGTPAPGNAGTTAGRYTLSGHGKAGVAKACTDCHDLVAAGHIGGASTKRMKPVNGQTYGARYATGTIDYCALACHATARKLHYTNGGAGTSFPADNTMDCLTCHNPHGQTLDATSTALATMIRPTIDGKLIVGFYNKATQNNYYVDPPNSGGNNRYGICQACHDPTDGVSNISWFNRTTATPGHKSGSLCTTCHVHTDTPAFKASGGACNDCHGYPPVQQLGAGTAAELYLYAKVEDYPGGGRAHAVVGHINPTGLDPTDGWTPCAPCHDANDHDMGLDLVTALDNERDTAGNWALEGTRKPRVNLDPAYGASGFYNMGNRATAAVGMGYCSNTTCHFSESPKWDCLPADTSNDPQ